MTLLVMTSVGRDALLDNGVKIPLIGCALAVNKVTHKLILFISHAVGTYKLRDTTTIESVTDAALANGYRLIGK